MKNLAVAYAMKKKAKNMAHGGSVDEGPAEKANKHIEGVNKIVPNYDRKHSEVKHGQSELRYGSKDDHRRVLAELSTMPPANIKGLAYGGETDEDMDPQEHIRDREEHQKGVHQTASNTTGSRTGMYSKMDPEHGKELHRRKLEEMKAIHPKIKGLADGGFVEEENMSGYPEDEMDMIGRIMKKREMSYSEGGKVADGGEDELSHMADSDPNNFDDLSMRDDLESSYTGENSGDEDGNERLDEDEKDIVERIMRSRSKKDRLPSPR